MNICGLVPCGAQPSPIGAFNNISLLLIAAQSLISLIVHCLYLHNSNRLRGTEGYSLILLDLASISSPESRRISYSK